MIRISQTYRHFVRLAVAAGLLVALPFMGNLTGVSATQMDHMGGDLHQSCVTSCSQMTNNVPPSVLLGGEEIRTPDPTPRPLPFDQYFVQYLSASNTGIGAPAPHFDTHPIRPPDRMARSLSLRI